MSRLVLASASPRRREILTTLGLSFAIEAAAVDEAVREGEPANELVRRLARSKALAVAATQGDAFVLGADTVVVVDGDVLNKPADDAEARAMIARIAGRWHEVLTGVALARRGAIVEEAAVATRVHVRALGAAAIDRYVASGEGRDKAGAYAVQGLGSGFVDRIEGSYPNVVGLPAAETIELLVRAGALAEWP